MSFLSQNQYCNNFTIILIVSIFFTLFYFLKLQRNNFSPVIKFILVLYSVFAVPRLLMIIFFPELIVFPFSNISVLEINSGLKLFLYSTIALFLGLHLGNKFYPPDEVKNRRLKISLKILCCIFIVALSIEAFLNFIVEETHYKISVEGLNTNTNYHYLYQFLRLFSSTEIILFFSLTLFFMDSERLKSWKWISIISGLVIIVSLMNILGGSRSGSLRLFLEFVSIFLVVSKINQIPIKAIMIFFSFIILLTSISFPLGTSIRNSIFSNQKWQSNEISRSIMNVPEKTLFHASLLTEVVNRLCIIDYAILIPYQTTNKFALRKYTSREYIFKSSINAILPGNPFPDAKLQTSRVIPIIFRNSDGVYDESTIARSYFSEYWTSFGLFYLMFGYFSICVHFIIGFVIHLGFVYISKIKSNIVVPFLVYYLYLFPSFILFTMGIDHSIQSLLILFVEFFIFIWTYKFFSLLTLNNSQRS